jgi:hypothetical protein
VYISARRFVTFVSALSLALCVVTAVFWARSYRVQDDWQFWYLVEKNAKEADLSKADHYISFRLYTGRGRVAARWADEYPPAGQIQPICEHAAWPTSTIETFGRSIRNRMGFAFFPSSEPARGGELIAPIWSVEVITVVIPALWMSMYIRQRRRRKDNLCIVCGYDLRATSDRCPECGTQTNLR